MEHSLVLHEGSSLLMVLPFMLILLDLFKHLPHNLVQSFDLVSHESFSSFLLHLLSVLGRGAILFCLPLILILSQNFKVAILLDD